MSAVSNMMTNPKCFSLYICIIMQIVCKGKHSTFSFHCCSCLRLENWELMMLFTVLQTTFAPSVVKNGEEHLAPWECHSWISSSDLLSHWVNKYDDILMYYYLVLTIIQITMYMSDLRKYGEDYKEKISDKRELSHKWRRRSGCDKDKDMWWVLPPPLSYHITLHWNINKGGQ